MAAKADKKKYFVLGLGKSGGAVARLLASHGSPVVIYDDSEVALQAAAQSATLEPLGALIDVASPQSVETQVAGADVVIVSPGVALDHPLVDRARSAGIEITGELEIAYSFCTSRIIAVTGTNGKSTVVSILGGILEEAGRRCVVAGNIGTPFSEVVGGERSFDVIVLEVSSFQLDTISRFRADVAVLLNVTADHLDRYDNSMAKYAASKSRILNRADADTVFVYNDDDAICKRIAAGFSGAKIPFSSETTLDTGVYKRGAMIERSWQGSVEGVVPVKSFSPVGVHNLENALAAVAAVTPLDIDNAVVKRALAAYRPLPHRMEMVRGVGGVAYINDSKATNVDATIKSVRSLDSPIILIMGGLDKNGDYQPLIDHLSRVKHVIVIGKASEKIKVALEGHCDVRQSGTMDDAVREAAEAAEAGDTVLLAPACASFDMFDNYAARGEAFRQAVNRL